MELEFILFFFAMLLSLYDVISCDAINVKDFREILRSFFWILATPLDIIQIFFVVLQYLDIVDWLNFVYHMTIIIHFSIATKLWLFETYLNNIHALKFLKVCQDKTGVYG